MKSILKFNERQPLLFALILLIAWMILVSIFAVLLGVLIDKPVADPLIQAIGALVATLILLLGAYRIGWINRIGITRFGSMFSWIATLVLSIYVILTGFYAYFEEISFQLGLLLDREAVPILLQGLRAGFVEEVVFRGIILYSLIRIWGKKKWGIVLGLVVQAVLFALPHTFQILAGVPLASVLSNLLATLIFGLWIGTLVFTVGSVWPAIFIHAVSNSFLLIKGLSSAWVTPYYLGYLHSALFEIPLVLMGLWIVLKLHQSERTEALSEPTVKV